MEGKYKNNYFGPKIIQKVWVNLILEEKYQSTSESREFGRFEFKLITLNSNKFGIFKFGREILKKLIRNYENSEAKCLVNTKAKCISNYFVLKSIR